MNKKQIRLLSPWSQRIETEHAVFCSRIEPAAADALLCMWSPSPELLSFPRRKAWYCCEPQCQFNAIENGKWPKIRSQLLPEEFLFHGHPDPRYRVPHMTHYDELVVDRSEHRVRKAIAVVSNCGNGPFSTHKDIQYRNGLITDPRVDLYIRRSWQQYRAYWYSWPRPPLNYRGEIPGDWPGGTKRQLMSQYKVCVCLENMNEPGYFTEKFVEAVRAGCIPVYKASADVRDTFLKGAVCFDPSDTKCLGRNAIGAALDASWHDIVDVDAQWLQKTTAETHPLLNDAPLRSPHSNTKCAVIGKMGTNSKRRAH